MMRGKMKIEAKLSWVIVDGDIHQVKDFSHLKPDQRPVAYCPECKRQVILRLGERRIFHAAHKAQDNCVLTSPETALHLNTKLYVAEELRKHKPLLINTYCKGYEGLICSNKKLSEYFTEWDQVKVEYHIDQYRPDIVLLKEGQTIGAVEIFVTHTIEPEKESYLKQLSIPWLEIDALKVLSKNEENNWTINDPVIYQKINNQFLEKWICNTCENKVNRKDERKEKIKNSEDYKITAFRSVDFLYTNGSHYRSIFIAKKRIQKGKITHLLIDENYNTVCEVKYINNEKSEKILREKFNKFLHSYVKKGHTVDFHMSWEIWQKSLPISEMKKYSIHSYFPRRYSWSIDQEKWIPRISYKKLSWNNYFSNKDEYLQFLKKKIIRYNQLISERENRIIKAYKKSISNPFVNSPTYVYHKPESKSVYESKINLPEATCIYCHQVTTDYWFFNNETKSCKCRSCLQKQRKEKENQDSN